MAVRMLDLTQQPERCTFTESPPEETSYAEAFWHSVRLQPTVESRLVSSDIKQRLGKKKKNTSKSSIASGQHSTDSGNKLKDFFMRARTLEQVAEYERLRRLSDARSEDRNMLHRRREERIKKEEISRDRIPQNSAKQNLEDESVQKEREVGQAYSIEEMIRDIDEFERMKASAENDATERPI